MSQLFAKWKNKATDAAPHSDPFNTYPKLTTELPPILLWHQFESKRSDVVTMSPPRQGMSTIPVAKCTSSTSMGLGPRFTGASHWQIKGSICSLLVVRICIEMRRTRSRSISMPWSVRNRDGLPSCFNRSLGSCMMAGVLRGDMYSALLRNLL